MQITLKEFNQLFDIKVLYHQTYLKFKLNQKGLLDEKPHDIDFNLMKSYYLQNIETGMIIAQEHIKPTSTHQENIQNLLKKANIEIIDNLYQSTTLYCIQNKQTCILVGENSLLEWAQIQLQQLNQNSQTTFKHKKTADICQYIEKETNFKIIPLPFSPDLMYVINQPYS